MSVNLNEFSIQELYVALAIFKEKSEDYQRKIERVERWDDSEVKNYHIKSYSGFRDTCLLWKVQIQNAINELALQHN